MTHRIRLLVAGLVCAVVAAVLVIVVTDPFSGSSAPSASRSSGPVPSPRISSTVNPATAPTPPAQGAYLGAWVGPDVFTQANEIAAVDSLQSELGHKLSIVHTYLKWQAKFPTPSDMAFVRQGSTLLISWAGTDTEQIISGADDSWIRTRAGQIKALGKPVFLEWRWEMDRPNLRSEEHSGADYVAAWDHIRAIFSAAGVTNAAWVWCPTAMGFSDGQAAAFYPGDNEVDWICADAYPQYGSNASFAATVNPFLSWASHHGKPVMIGEFGVPESYGAQQRAHWLRAAQQVVVADRQIKALLYFDANPAGQGPAGSYALGVTEALSAFRAIAEQPYFNPGVLP
jgi:Glycosyl hydrolase family 26